MIKELIVRLTNESDPFFLYTLSLSEEDFQRCIHDLLIDTNSCHSMILPPPFLPPLSSLKVQQGLLVDFSDFPKKLIDLLELCLSENNKDSPKYVS